MQLQGTHVMPLPTHCVQGRWLFGHSKGLRKGMLKLKGMKDTGVQDSERSSSSFTQIFEKHAERTGQESACFLLLVRLLSQNSTLNP